MRLYSFWLRVEQSSTCRYCTSQDGGIPREFATTIGQKEYTIYIHNAHAVRTGGLCIRGAERPGEMERTGVYGAAWGLGV
jgi:hypothetical protein